VRKQRIFRVLVTLELSSVAGRKKLNGIHRFLGEGHDWDMELVRTDRDLTASVLQAAASETYDGFLLAGRLTPELRRTILAVKRPMVIVNYPDEAILKGNPHALFIFDDMASVARAAADTLLSLRGLKSFGYVPTRTPCLWSDDRGNGLRQALSRHGFALATYDGDGQDRAALADWLKNLAHPAGIVAAFDDRAYDVAEACRSSGLRIPDDIALVGIGNDEAICEMARPTLSSVAIDFEQEGYRAARELQAMLLAHRKPQKRHIVCGTRETVMRESLPAVTAITLVKRARAFIEAHALEGIGVPDVVAHLRVSRRLADLRFHEETGTTILEEILACRLGEVKRLLTATDLPIAEIATRCGYRDANYLKNLFRRRCGTSMRAWRKGNTGNAISRK